MVQSFSWFIKIKNRVLIVHSTTSWRTKEWNRVTALRETALRETQEEEKTAENPKGRSWIIVDIYHQKDEQEWRACWEQNHPQCQEPESWRGRAWSKGLEDVAEEQQKIEAHGVELFGKRNRVWCWRGSRREKVSSSARHSNRLPEAKGVPCATKTRNSTPGPRPTFWGMCNVWMVLSNIFCGSYPCWTSKAPNLQASCSKKLSQ